MLLQNFYTRSKQKLLAKTLFIANFFAILILTAGIHANANQNYRTFHPPIEVHGRVVSDDGKPLAGVSVLIAGTQTGTTTDSDGRFTLTVPNANTTLEISSIGFHDKRVNVATQTEVSITLERDIAGLSDVVVVGYGTEKKANLTGAVSNVTSKVLESRPITSIGQGLQGTISNLNITPGSGALGQASSFNVRGNTSINGGSPLILVDGIPMDINLLNPNDIDNVTVLKDAASAAIYGARAAYGVILVTTKTGKKRGGKPRVSLSSFYSVNKPTVRIDFIDTKDRIEWMNEAYMRVNGRNYYDDITIAAMMAHYNDPSKPSSIIHPAAPGVWTGVANTEWEKILQNESYPMHQHTASISGNTDKFQYYTSFSYLNQKGLTKKTFFDERLKRYNLMANLSYHVLDWITIGAKTSINTSEKRFPPNYPWYGNEFAEDRTIYQAWTYSTQPFKDPNGNWSHEGSIGNPAQMLVEGGYQTRNINDVWMTGTVQIRPIKGMTVNLNYSANTKSTNELRYARSFPLYDVEGNVRGYYMSPNRATRVDYNDKYHVFNAFADYRKTFNNKHNLTLLLGLNQEDARYDYLWGERRNLIIDRIPYMTLATGNTFAFDGTNEFAIRGVFGRVNYVYDDRYLFEFNGRYDGSSKFPKDSRYALFPSASVGWRIDNEKFFASLKHTINHLKIRASYGSLGNQNVAGYYPYIATLSASQVNYVIGGNTPMSVFAPGLVSSSLTWETVIQKNLGIDFAFLNSRLNGSFDIYTRDTKDMLTRSQTLPAVLAVNEPRANAADLRTKGFDLNITWTDRVGSDLRYEVGFLLGDYIAKITKYSNPAGLISDYYVGAKLGEIWGLTTGGIFQTDAEAQALNQSDISGRQRQAGDLWMVDLNKDGKITRGARTLSDPGDLSVIGNSTPRYNFGFRTSVGWKGFDLDIFLQGVGRQQKWIDETYFLSQYYNEWGDFPKMAMDYWKPKNPNAFFPRPVLSGTADIWSVQSRFLQNSAYIRLKQLTLSNTLPLDVTKKVGMERVKVFFTGANLWTKTKMVDIADPETNGANAYPLYKSFSLGANIDF